MEARVDRETFLTAAAELRAAWKRLRPVAFGLVTEDDGISIQVDLHDLLELFDTDNIKVGHRDSKDYPWSARATVGGITVFALFQKEDARGTGLVFPSLEEVS